LRLVILSDAALFCFSWVIAQRNYYAIFTRAASDYPGFSGKKCRFTHCTPREAYRERLLID
jgi:hypothetical protein